VTRLHVHRFGPRESTAVPVVAIHGVMGHGARFGLFAAAAFPDRPVLALDLRGHADSTWDPPWDAATHVADVLDTLDAASGAGGGGAPQLARVDVVGHSFGGLLATHLAATAPERVRRVVLLDPAIGLDPARMRDAAEETRLDDGWPSFEEALAARLADRPPQAITPVREDLKEHLAEGDDGRFRLRFSRSAVIVGWSEMTRPPAPLREFPGELLLVIADTGGYVTPTLRESLGADLGPRFTERTVRAGHMIWWDALEDTAALVGAFLDGRDVPTVAPRAEDVELEEQLAAAAADSRVALSVSTAPR
jgi:lipase